MLDKLSLELIIKVIVPTPIISNVTSALLQADIEDLILFVVNEFGAEVTGNITSSWDTENNILKANIDSGSFRGDAAENIEMSISINSIGDIISVFAKATLMPGDIRITANIVPADVNDYRKQVVKQAYNAVDALEKVTDSLSNNDITLIILKALGYSQITGLSSDWDNESLTATIEYETATLNNTTTTQTQIIISIDENGDIDFYNIDIFINDIQVSYGESDLDDAEKFVLEIGNYAMIDIYNTEQAVKAANHTSLLTNNISFDLYKEGSDTNQDLVIDNGELNINEDYSFDSIKITNANHYTQDINISDAIDVLRHIVDLEAFTSGSAGFHAADVDNNDSINISDAIDILRHIVDLEAIDTFDIIDSEGNRVTQLDANSSGDAPTWTIVANGDADLSGGFADAYVVTSDIV